MMLPGAPMGAPAALDPDRGQARAWAEQELLGKEYQADRPGPVQLALQWLRDHLSRVHTPNFSPPVGLAIVVLIVLAVVALVLWRSGGLGRQARSGKEELFGGASFSAADHRAAADAAEAAGDLGTAVVERFRALIRALADRDLVPLGPGLTADEAARWAGEALPELATELHTAAGTFDDVRYGDRPGTLQQIAFLRDLDGHAAATRPRAGVS
jgi:hypothetical protein